MKIKSCMLIILFLWVTNSLATTICSSPNIECIEPGGTRYFEGIPVTLNCWHYRTISECRLDNENKDKLAIKEDGSVAEISIAESRVSKKICELIPKVVIKEALYSGCNKRTGSDGREVSFVV